MFELVIWRFGMRTSHIKFIDFYACLLATCIFAIFISIFPANGYIYDFEEGMEPGWSYGGCKAWYLDSKGNNSKYSLRSGEIDCTGSSSISRIVEGEGKGPVEISFYWKKSGSTINSFTFSVDGCVERTCRSYEWDEVRYTLPNDSERHEIRWDFKKKTCYSQGVGWIDDVSIKPERGELGVPSANESVYKTIVSDLGENVTAIKDVISDLEENVTGIKDVISSLEENVTGLNLAGLTTVISDQEGNVTSLKDVVSGMEGNVTSLKDVVSGMEGNVTSLKDVVSGMEGNVTSLKDVVSGMEGNVTSLGTDISGKRLPELISQIICIQNFINLSKPHREQHTMYMRTGDDLQDKINENPKNTTFILTKDYTYKGKLDINNNIENINIISEDETAVLDGNGRKYTIKLYNTSYISITGVKVCNSEYGIFINRSQYCEIKGNTIQDFKSSGLYILNSSDNIICDNIITSDNDKVYGIWLYGSDKILIKNSTIDVGWYSFYLDDSYDNVINITQESIVPSSNVTFFDNGNAYKLYLHPEDHHTFGYGNLFTRDLDEYNNLWACTK